MKTLRTHITENLSESKSKSWADVNMKKAAKSCINDEGKSAEFDDVESWLDMYAQDKGIEEGMDLWEATEFMDEMYALGLKKTFDAKQLSNY